MIPINAVGVELALGDGTFCRVTLTQTRDARVCLYVGHARGYTTVVLERWMLVALAELCEAALVQGFANPGRVNRSLRSVVAKLGRLGEFDASGGAALRWHRDEETEAERDLVP